MALDVDIYVIYVDAAVFFFNIYQSLSLGTLITRQNL